jgi:hypothetical protein
MSRPSIRIRPFDWEGRHVLLTPPSTIATNKRVVWAEFFLARLLRERGAVVESFHVPDRDGRRQTFATAGGEGELVVPPHYSWEAYALAEAAGRRARELRAYRLALPRKKASPKLEKAVAFLRGQGVQRLTNDLIRQAERKGIKETTLRRAMKELSGGDTDYNTLSSNPSLLRIAVYLAPASPPPNPSAA